MSIAPKLKRFLDERNIPYELETHPEAFTAQQVAQSAHISGWAFAKSVIVNIDGAIAMAVLPAAERIDVVRLGVSLGARKVRLAVEAEFAHVFDDCDLGGEPVFGSLYGVPVLVSKDLLENEEIAFNAGTHRDVVHVRVADFLDAEQPRVLEREGMAA